MAIVFQDTRGENNPNAKITADQAAEIRREYDTGLRGGARAKHFGISPERYNMIGQRRGWWYAESGAGQ